VRISLAPFLFHRYSPLFAFGHGSQLRVFCFGVRVITRRRGREGGGEEQLRVLFSLHLTVK
jgi:hypothetical protein